MARKLSSKARAERRIARGRRRRLDRLVVAYAAGRTFRQLREEAKALCISGRGRMRKAQLAKAVYTA